jgi:phasin family protein
MANAKESIEMINEFNKNGYDSFRQLTDINLNTWNEVMESQLNSYNSLLTTGMEHIKLVSEAKDYKDVVRSHMDLTRKLGEELLTKTRETLELSQKTGEEVRNWYESNLTTANEQISKVAERSA